jgi:hypothetical protein
MSTPKAISLGAKTVFINVITDSVSRVERKGFLEYRLVDPNEPSPLDAVRAEIQSRLMTIHYCSQNSLQSTALQGGQKMVRLELESLDRFIAKQIEAQDDDSN